MKFFTYGIFILAFFESSCFIIDNRICKSSFSPSSGPFSYPDNQVYPPRHSRLSRVSALKTSESIDHKEFELKQLRDKLASISDPNFTLEEKYIKASGPGGQKINKSAICDQLIYSNASGSIKITIKCKKHRTLMLNRIEATKLLIARIEAIRNKELMDVKREEFKESVKRRGISEKSKHERMVFKKNRAEKKRLRSRSVIHDSDY